MRNVTLLRKDSHELRMRKMAEEILENSLSEYDARIRYQIKSIATVQKWVCILVDEKFLMADDHSSKPKSPGVVQKLHFKRLILRRCIMNRWYAQMIKNSVLRSKKIRYQVIH